MAIVVKGIMKAKNCWEIKNRGKQPGGNKLDGRGICPAAAPGPFDNENGGKHGGRFCWAVPGTLCGGTEQGECEAKLETCLDCEVLKMIQEEEGRRFVLLPPDGENAS